MLSNVPSVTFIQKKYQVTKQLKIIFIPGTCLKAISVPMISLFGTDLSYRSPPCEPGLKTLLDAFGISRSVLISVRKFADSNYNKPIMRIVQERKKMEKPQIHTSPLIGEN